MAKSKEKEEAVIDPRVEMFNAINALPESTNNASVTKRIDGAVALKQKAVAIKEALLLCCLTDTTCCEYLMPSYDERQRLQTTMNEVLVRYNALKNTTDGQKAIANAYAVALNR